MTANLHNPAPTGIAVTAPTAGVNVSTTTVTSMLVSNLFSMLTTIGVPMLTMTMGSTPMHYIAAALGFAAGAGSVIAQSYGFIHGNTAASRNTIATINSYAQLAANAAASMGNPVGLVSSQPAAEPAS